MSSTCCGQTKYRFLALGDSYTIGEGVDDENHWPHQLVEALRSEGLPLAEPEMIARTGWTTSEFVGGNG